MLSNYSLDDFTHFYNDENRHNLREDTAQRYSRMVHRVLEDSDVADLRKIDADSAFERFANNTNIASNTKESYQGTFRCALEHFIDKKAVEEKEHYDLAVWRIERGEIEVTRKAVPVADGLKEFCALVRMPNLASDDDEEAWPYFNCQANVADGRIVELHAQDHDLFVDDAITEVVLTFVSGEEAGKSKR